MCPSSRAVRVDEELLRRIVREELLRQILNEEALRVMAGYPVGAKLRTVTITGTEITFPDGTTQDSAGITAPGMIKFNFLYYLIWGKAVYTGLNDGYYMAPDVLADAKVSLFVRSDFGERSYPCVARFIDYNNAYYDLFCPDYATEDHALWKRVAGTYTELKVDAVDLYTYDNYYFGLGCLGTAIKGYREETEPKEWREIYVTDTDLASGKFGLCAGNYRGTQHWQYSKLVPEASEPIPRPLAYFEMPLVGEGTEESPYTVKMPEELFEDPALGRRNALAVRRALLMPTPKGQPVDSVAIVRVCKQPDRDPALRPLPECIQAIRRMEGVRELVRDEAIARARRLDDKLHIFDLIAVERPTKAQVREYISWRRDVHGVEMSEERAEGYLKLEKGW